MRRGSRCSCIVLAGALRQMRGRCVRGLDHHTGSCPQHQDRLPTNSLGPPACIRWCSFRGGTGIPARSLLRAPLHRRLEHQRWVIVVGRWFGAGAQWRLHQVGPFRWHLQRSARPDPAAHRRSGPQQFHVRAFRYRLGASVLIAVVAAHVGMYSLRLPVCRHVGPVPLGCVDGAAASCCRAVPL